MTKTPHPSMGAGFQIQGARSNDHPPRGWLGFSASGRKDKSTSVLAALRLRKQTISCHEAYPPQADRSDNAMKRNAAVGRFTKSSRLLGITPSAGTNQAGRGETLANDQGYKLIASKKCMVSYPYSTFPIRFLHRAGPGDVRGDVCVRMTLCDDRQKRV